MPSGHACRPPRGRLDLEQPAACSEGGSVSLAIRATSEGILSRESARSRAHSRTAVTTESRGDPYKRRLRFARQHARGRRVWAIESSGSFGAGLTAFLLAHREWVVEVDRPRRPARRNGAKS